jgi:glucose/arabinose dehydrogenase
MKLNSIILVFAGVLFFSCAKDDMVPDGTDAITAEAKPGMAGVKTKVLNSNLNFPWEILWGPDNYIWFTEREGRVKRMNPATGDVTLVATIPEVASTTDYNGLLGMALHPQFKDNPYVYLVYNYFNPGGHYLEKIVRYTYDNETLTAPMVLVDGIVGKVGGDFIHNGSRLLIGPDMKLYATTGDANMRFELPQYPTSLNGKVLRINLDGSIPADNPYHNAVWTIGHRNSQGLTFAFGNLYSSEHGETTNDEINIIEGGRNYGWPYVEGFIDTRDELDFGTANNVKEPIYAWTPTVAPSGIEYYDSNTIAQWKKSLLVTFLKDQKLRVMKINREGTVEKVTEYFAGEFGRLRDVAVSPTGVVYLCTDNGHNADMIIEVSKLR